MTHNNMEGKEMIVLGNNGIFHVHTFRCRHASEEGDEDYIKKAIELGAKFIAFTDHGPFPGNIFGYRMDIEELPEYLHTMNGLREKYRDQIKVYVGLEIEYFPGFDCMANGESYYKQLKAMKGLDFLMLVQHMYETDIGRYSFSLSDEEIKRLEAPGMGKAIVDGIATGYFDVVAHPDRSFRSRKVWDEDLAQIGRSIIEQAIRYDVILEQNESSKRHKGQYWTEFWDIASEISEAKPDGKELKIIRGLDAHETGELSILDFLQIVDH